MSHGREMKIEDFWNHAFLAALGRLPAQEAKDEADKATELCIEFWRSNRLNWAPLNILRWQDQEVTNVPQHYVAAGSSENATSQV